MVSVTKLIDSGFAAIPTPYGSKGPIARGWNEKRFAITSAGDAYRLDGKNVGVALAYCTPPMCTLDVDDLEQTRLILSTLGIDVDALLCDPSAVQISSGRPNRAKLLYRLPEGLAPYRSVVVRGSDGTVAFEIRCADRQGKTLQDQIPPSKHPSGSNYVWAGAGDPLAPPVIGKDLMRLWESELAKVEPSENGCRFETPRRLKRHATDKFETPREIANVRFLLDRIDSDCDYCTWRTVVWAVLNLGWSCSEELAREWSMRAPQRYSERTFQQVLRSFDPIGHQAPTIRSIIYLAHH